MDPPRYRDVIEYLLKNGLKSKQIHEELVNTYGGYAHHIAIVKKWVREFRRGRESLEDDDRGRRAITASTPETVSKVLLIVIKTGAQLPGVSCR